jgi:hypothetical protein
MPIWKLEAALKCRSCRTRGPYRTDRQPSCVRRSPNRQRVCWQVRAVKSANQKKRPQPKEGLRPSLTPLKQLFLLLLAV